jgi:hypothetical protein
MQINQNKIKRKKHNSTRIKAKPSISRAQDVPFSDALFPLHVADLRNVLLCSLLFVVPETHTEMKDLPHTQ